MKVITAALIYANGSVHIGHLVEYIQTDVYARFCKLSGENAIYVCADDTHGTPIQINAEKLGITPEELIEKAYKEHIKDFEKYHIKFDVYHSTNSKENKEVVEIIYNRLKENGYIYKKEVEATYCEHCNRFLPDRYVKGKCPYCGAEDQYGDVCEKCNATYKPSDLIDPYCIICGNKPVLKTTEQIFFKLSAFEDKLKEYINSRNFQPEIKNYLLKWIEQGLKDWDISREPPYFGFKIPEMEKYFYVWFDAPIGYIGSTKKYCDDNGISWENVWIKGEGEVIHFIGKDIIYHHFLYWPAMLMGANFKVPDHIQVHGFLNVEGEKMSKTRGTFFTASDFIKIGGDPEYLRFFYTYNLSENVQDFNFSEKEYKNLINGTLIDKFGNLVYRASSFLYKNFDATIGDKIDSEIIKDLHDFANEFINIMKKFKYRKGLEALFRKVDLINKYFQDNEVWKLIKTDKEKTYLILNTTLNAINIITILLSPIIPEYTKKIAKQLNFEIGKDFINHIYKNHKINKPKIVFKKVDESFTLKKQPEIMKLLIKVGKIVEIKPHPDAERLYVLKVDIGDEERQLVAGLKKFYKEDELRGKKILVLTNLKKAKLRGIESQGMLLAASDENDVGVLTTEAEVGTVVGFDEFIPESVSEITIKEFQKIKIISDGNKVFYENLIAHAGDYPVFPDKGIKGNIS